MGKAIRNIFKTDTLVLSECTDGFYLYDYIEGMNVNESQNRTRGLY